MPTASPFTRWYAAIAVAALVFGFLLTAQLRSALAPPSDRVGRNAQLVATVQRLEADNASNRRHVADLRAQIAALEQQAAARSDASRRLAEQVDDLRARAGLTQLKGPGLTLTLADGKGGAGARVGYQDVEDAVLTLFAGGAEGVAVDGYRISPASRFSDAGGAVVVDDGGPLVSPFRVDAVGDRAGMTALLERPATLGDLKRRADLYSLVIQWSGSAAVELPAYDSSLTLRYAHGPQP
jgi:uncharacterized protein YlxW (UPF0749 family)